MPKNKGGVLMKQSAFQYAMSRLKSIYDSDWFLPDKEAVKEWYMVLGYLSPKQLNEAISYWIANNKNAPVPADLIAYVELIGGEEGGGNPFDDPLWILFDTATGRIVDEVFTPPGRSTQQMFDWFQRNKNNMFGKKIILSSYDEVYVQKVYQPKRPPVLPEGYESWRQWAVDPKRLRGIRWEDADEEVSLG